MFIAIPVLETSHVDIVNLTQVSIGTSPFTRVFN